MTEKEVKTKVDLVEMAKALDAALAKLRKLEDKMDRHSQNWLRFWRRWIGPRADVNAKDGEVGSVRIWALLGVFILSASLLFGAGEVRDYSQGTGIARFNQTSRTGDITLEINAGTIKNTLSVATNLTVSSGGTLTLTGVTVAGWGSVSSGLFTNATFNGTTSISNNVVGLGTATISNMNIYATPIGVSVPAAGAFTTLSASGDFTGALAGTLDNAVVDDWRFTYTNDTAILGQLILESGVSGLGVAANDTIEMQFKANDDETNMVTWLEIEVLIADETFDSKDTTFAFKGYKANSAVTFLAMDATGLDVLGQCGADTFAVNGVAGFSGPVTNLVFPAGPTNILWYGSGIVTNVSYL